MKDHETQENAAPGGTGAADCSIPAFPGQFYYTNLAGETRVRHSNEGMTLRDWFAGHALAGLLGNEYIRLTTGSVPRTMASMAYKQADAILKARESNAEVTGR